MTRRYLPRGIQANHALSYAAAEAVGVEFREVAGLGDTPMQAFPCAEFFEQLDDLKVVHGDDAIPLSYGVEGLPRPLEAKTRYCADNHRIEIILSVNTYEALLADNPRARFSLLHEFAHAVVHCGEVVRLADALHHEVGLYRTTDHKPFEDTEWQADAVAAAALVPAKGLSWLSISGPLTEAAVAEQFQVSRKAAGIRIGVFRKHREELLAAA